MEHFCYKGRCGVFEHTHAEEFKRSACYHYRLTASDYYYLLAIYSYLK